MLTLQELKHYLKFNLNSKQKKITDSETLNIDGFICHEDSLDMNKNLVNKLDCFKVLATSQNNKNSIYFDYILKLPTSIKEINNLIETSAAKKKFNLNSSIKVKSYLLNKNEKKLFKGEIFIILTEKEIQLLELFLATQRELSKNFILSSVWNYSPDADTHTVETHIYRLRKKIYNKFSDENFILNNKAGYYL